MSSELTKVNGVGPATVPSLEEHGFHSIEDLASATVEEVILVPGYGESRATQAIASAKGIVAESSTTQSKPKKKNAVETKLAKAGKKVEASAKAEKEKLGKAGTEANTKAKALAKAEKKKLAKAGKKAKAKAKKQNNKKP
jgi:nucleotidyltransferase/DNA polymerase involved in DNA repair